MRAAEIFEQAQTLTAAFFGVKLSREDIVAGDDGGEIVAVVANAGDKSRIRQFTETSRKKSTTMPLKISGFSSGAAWAAPGITARSAFRMPRHNSCARSKG